MVDVGMQGGFRGEYKESLINAPLLPFTFNPSIVSADKYPMIVDFMLRLVQS